MKALVVGGGSIGTRHLGNLRAAGVETLAVVEPDPARRGALEGLANGGLFATLEEGLDGNPDLVVVATPTRLHLSQALAAARRGCDLFIEKPLSHSEEGLEELAAETRRRGLVTLVGCNMRFHPGPARVRRLLEEGRIGPVLFARIHAGSYLPAWRPGQDYRRSYSAHASEGGGVLLDLVHEVDLARWYLGEVREVFCRSGRLSSLEIDAEDFAALICTHEDGTVSEIHLDYVQRTYERGCQIVGEEGSLFWDFREGTVRLYRAPEQRWESWGSPEGWELNRMYAEEISHLLDCIRERRPTMLPVSEGIRIQRILSAARESARTGRSVAAMGVPA